jgi:hypothetical protein
MAVHTGSAGLIKIGSNTVAEVTALLWKQQQM